MNSIVLAICQIIVFIIRSSMLWWLWPLMELPGTFSKLSLISAMAMVAVTGLLFQKREPIAINK